MNEKPNNGEFAYINRAYGLTRMDELDEAGLREAEATFGATGNFASAILAYLRASTIGGEPVATQYRYWYSSGEPGVWLNERRKDADDLLESGVLIREETRALYLHPSIGDSEAGAESSLRNVQRSGWKLVPAEPPDDLIREMARAHEDSVCDDLVGPMEDAYHAMLAAAPKVST